MKNGGSHLLNKKISVIIPCYNEGDVLSLFEKEITRVADSLKDVVFEFIYVNDGSKDNTLDIIKEMANNDKRVKYISFSRNFFKEAGIYAGLKKATGDFAVIIDADLQHNPDLIIEMYEAIVNEGYDSVAVRRVNRKGEPFIRSVFGNLYHKMIRILSDIEVVDGETDYRMMSKAMYKAVLEVGEYNRYSKGIFSWVGFKTKWLEQENIERVEGDSKIPFFKAFKYAITGLTAFSAAPLALASFMGMVFCLISFIMIIFIIIKTLIFGDPTSGWPSMVCIMFFIGGIQLFCLGIIGQYLSKTYLETKKRPLYIIKETNIKDSKNA